MPQLAAGTCLRSHGEGEQDPEAAKPLFAESYTCLDSQAWEVPPEVGEANRGASPSPSSPCRCVYWGGPLPSSCVSAWHPHLPVTHTFQHKPARPEYWHLPVPARTDPSPLLPYPPRVRSHPES